MKVKDLRIGQEIVINTFKYTYKGVNKVRMSGYWAQKIVFKGIDVMEDKLFDLKVMNKELKETNGVIELK